METKIKIDENIFQDLVTFYTKFYNLTPLSAKIFAYFIFDFEKKGLTFDEIHQIFGCSKSSVSTNLNLLLNTGFIKDFTSIRDRKRKFVAKQDYEIMSVKNLTDRMSEEIKIMKNIKTFRGGIDDDVNKNYEIYSEVLIKSLKYIINETLQKV